MATTTATAAMARVSPPIPPARAPPVGDSVTPGICRREAWARAPPLSRAPMPPKPATPEAGVAAGAPPPPPKPGMPGNPPPPPPPIPYLPSMAPAKKMAPFFMPSPTAEAIWERRRASYCFLRSRIGARSAAQASFLSLPPPRPGRLGMAAPGVGPAEVATKASARPAPRDALVQWLEWVMGLLIAASVAPVRRPRRRRPGRRPCDRVRPPGTRRAERPARSRT